MRLYWREIHHPAYCSVLSRGVSNLCLTMLTGEVTPALSHQGPGPGAEVGSEGRTVRGGGFQSWRQDMRQGNIGGVGMGTVLTQWLAMMEENNCR